MSLVQPDERAEALAGRLRGLDRVAKVHVDLGPSPAVPGDRPVLEITVEGGELRRTPPDLLSLLNKYGAGIHHTAERTSDRHLVVTALV